MGGSFWATLGLAALVASVMESQWEPAEAGPPAAPFKAGFAERDITPELGIPLRSLSPSPLLCLALV